VITDSLITAISNAGLDVVLSQTGQLPMNILASAAGEGARIELGFQNGTDTSTFTPLLAPRLLAAGGSTRIRLPGLRTSVVAGWRMIGRSNKPVVWSVTNQTIATPAGISFGMRTYRVPASLTGATTAIFGPSTGSPKWRIVGVVCCNPNAASSVVSLLLRTNTGGSPNEVRIIAGPTLVPPYGSVRIANPAVLDLAESGALFATSETSTIWNSYGVTIP